MTNRRLLALGVVLAALAALGGCKRFSAANCSKPQIYAAAQTLAPLRIPVGLDAPNTNGALRIPELNEPEAPRSAADPCLDSPPKYASAATTN
jgi:uncharacterized lipoprotein